VVPHFEKMLYDNALLLRVYLHLWKETGAALARRVVTETAEFLLRDLRTAQGGFASALDADTDGVEGRTYAWSRSELVGALGADDGIWAAELLSVTAEGTFEHGRSTLQLLADPDPSELDRWAGVHKRLFAARSERPQPGRDDKVVAAWNGLAIAALAEAGAVLSVPSYVDAAGAAADLLLRVQLDGGRLLRTSRDGMAGPNAGVLEDYADVAEGLLALHQATADPRWLSAAGDLLDTVLTRFTDGAGGFYDTADDAETLIRRPWDPTDGPVPSGASAAAGALLTHSALAGRPDHRAAAEALLATLTPIVARYPRATGWACATAEAAHAGPLQVAIPTAPDDAPDLLHTARVGTSPGLVVVAGPPEAPGVPLLADRPLVAGHPAAYVCRGFVCDLPTTDPTTLASQVRALRA
jgi:uncharacterized protein YyaL (SSP411 family)